MPRSPTVIDVARTAGVSASTVSRYLNGERIRRATVVERAIDELGYRPSAAARTLKSGRTLAVAVVVPDVTNPFFAAVVRGVGSSSDRHDYTVLLADTDESPERECAVLDSLLGRVDGVILVPAREELDGLTMAQRAGIPVVLVDRQTSSTDTQADTVLVDNIGGSRAAVEHLVSLGHRRIAAIHGPFDSTPGRERAEGFRTAVEAAGLLLPPGYEQAGEFREQGGVEAAHALLALEDPPSAIFVANNLMTVGALYALAARGVAVPDELSLVGFDDHPYASLLQPPLTVVDRPMEQQGALAMQLLLRRLEGEAKPPRRCVLETQLVVRASTAAPMPSASTRSAARRRSLSDR